MPDTIQCNDLLNCIFDDGRILKADIPELKRYLLASTEMRDTDILNRRVKEGLPKRAEFVKYLIQIKQAEIAREAEARRSKWTLGVSIGTLLILISKTLYEILN